MSSKAILSLLLGATMIAPVACASGEAPDLESASKRPFSAQITTPADDIVPFEGAGGPTGVGRAPAEDQVARVPANLAEEIGSSCSQSFPPPASLPCAVPEAGRVYYVSAKGNDASDGATPDRAWATLFHAVKTADARSTIRVAEGHYTSAEVHVDRALVIKGGFDATFASWDPDTHATYFFGKLALAHDHAIWGGFHIVSRFSGETGRPVAETRHMVSGGTLIRNFVEIDYRASADQRILYGVVAAAPEGHRSRLYCNDVYVRGEGASSAPSLDVRGIAYDGASAFGGEARLSSNRVCVDRGRGVLSAEAVGGSPASGGASAARMTMTNNVIEAHGDEAQGLRAVLGVRFTGGARDLDVVATNNTIYSETDGIVGLASASGGKVTWRLTNNVVFSKAGRDGVNVGPRGSRSVAIAESSGNLVFGFMHNPIVPSPLASTNDDTSGVWTVREVLGQSFIPNDDGPARRGAINVFGDPTYGAVRTDVWSSTRPADGTWTRGAVQ